MGCENCPLKSRSVGPRGPRDARIVLIGEAPGQQELQTGLPFVGPSGRLLERALKRCGVEAGSEGMFVLNAVRCLPPKAKLTECCKACHSLLDQELLEYQHDVLILLGNTAVRSVTGDYGKKITTARGHAIETPYGIAVPTFHPAFVLRPQGRGMYPQFLEDLRYALSIAQGADVKSPGVVEWVVVDDDNWSSAVATLAQYQTLAADIETSERNPRKDRILCIGVGGEKNKVFIFPEPQMYRLRELFESDIKWVWHNGKFDTAFLETYGFNTRIDQDTMLQSYMLNEAGSHKLKELAASLLGAANWAGDLKKWLDDENPSFANVPEDVLYKYLAQDVDNTLQLYHLFSARLDEPREKGPKWAYEHVLIPAANFLREVEHNGAWVDVERIEELRGILTKNTEELRQKMRDYVSDQNFNPNSPMQVKSILRRSGIHVESTDKEHLAPFLKRSEFVRLLMEYRAEAKQLSTYVNGMLKRMDDEHKVHSTFTLHVAVNGRLSSKNPNMQNLPAGPKGKRIKRLIGAPPGRRVIELDYSQAELRCLAVLSGDEWLKQVYIDGRDLHDEVSIELFGPNFTSEQRRLVKTLNFGIPYGRQAAAIAHVFHLTTEDAQARIDAWFARMPKAHEFLMRQRASVRKPGFVISAFGRKRRFPMVTLEDLNEMENQASNHAISSTASDLTLKSSIAITPRLRTVEAFIFNLVHDSTMINGPDQYVMAVAGYAKRVMEQMPALALKTDIPFKADVKVGRWWGDAEEVNKDTIERILEELPPQVYPEGFEKDWWL